MARISIEGIEFYAKHGCFEEEQTIGNFFIVDLIIDYNSLIAEKTDNIDDALDYQKLFECVKKEMQTPAFLLESLCKRIIETIKSSFPTAENINLKIAKKNPSLGKGVKVKQVSTSLNWKNKLEKD